MPSVNTDFDLCVVGGGEAGFAMAQAGIAVGLTVVLIDSGSNDPCWRNWDVALAVLRLAGGRADRSAPSSAFRDFQRDLNNALDRAAADRRFARLAAMNIRVIRGRARFTGSDRLAVEGHTIRARRFVLATGARPPLRASGAGVLEHLRGGPMPPAFTALDGDERAVALALGLGRFGIGATLHASEGLLSSYDPELLAPVRRALHSAGVEILEAEAAHADVRSRDGELVYAPATEPALADLDSAAADIDLRDGALCLSPALCTTNPRVFAVGGVAGARSSQAVQAQVGVVLRSAFFRLPARYDPMQVPNVVNAEPGLAMIGLDERASRAKGPVTIWRWPLAETAAGAARSADGFVKIVADRRGIILGAGIVGSDAAEQVGIWTLAVRRRMTLADIATLPLPGGSLADASRRAASQFLVRKLQSPWTKRALALVKWFG